MAKKTKSESQAGAQALGVDLLEMKRLLDFMQIHGLEEFDYEGNGIHVRLKKPSSLPQSAPQTLAPLAVPPQVASAPGSAASAGGGAGAPREGAGEALRPDDVHIVKSPIVGTFYASPSPEAEKFVAVGARVEPGQVLCIIEAMKLMNEIESDVAGEVVRIFVENGHPVEYGEPLFGIQPRRKK